MAIRGNNLTSREKEILEFVMIGHSNKEIARTLYVDEGTVKSHVRNILGKLHCRNRVQVISRVFTLAYALDLEDICTNVRESIRQAEKLQNL